MLATLKAQLTGWMFSPRAVESGEIELLRSRVYILPTRQGMIFAIVLLMTLLGAINYSLSLGFVLTFLLAAMAFNGMLYTFRNLVRLRVHVARPQPVFAGETVQFAVHLFNPASYHRYAIGISREKNLHESFNYADVAAGASTVLPLDVPSERRGWMSAGRITLFTRFPLGLYQAWSYLQPDVRCIVYPRPAAAGLPLPPAEAAAGSGSSLGQGHEDFAGLRAYHAGDPPRHIAWKAAARGQGLLTKQFSGQAAQEVWLTWEKLPQRMPVEEKISCLARWVLDAHTQNLAYGLRLPGSEIAMARADAQRDRCLEALALFNLPSSGDAG